MLQTKSSKHSTYCILCLYRLKVKQIHWAQKPTANEMARHSILPIFEYCPWHNCTAIPVYIGLLLQCMK